MNQRQVVILICTVTLILGSLSLCTTVPSAAPPQMNSQPQRIPAPVAVVYSALFHHVADVIQQADETQRQGYDTSSLRSIFQRKANLSYAQARDLDQIAADCVREVAAQDARAQQIINDFKLRFPPGKLARGVKLPPPPPELTQMQEERDTMILHARTRLRAALGEDGFQRFDELVAGQVASTIKPIPLHLTASRPLPAPLPKTSSVVTKGGGAK